MLLSVCLSVCCCLSALVCAAVCFSMCTAVCLPWCVCHCLPWCVSHCLPWCVYRCLPWCAGSISSNGIHVLTYILMGQESMPPLRNTFAGVSALHLLPRLSKTLLLCGPHSLKQGDHLLGGEFGFVCLLQEYPEFAVHSSLHGNAFTEQLMSFSPPPPPMPQHWWHHHGASDLPPA